MTGLESGQEAGVKVDSGDNLGDTLVSGTIWIRVIIATVCKSAVLQARFTSSFNLPEYLQGKYEYISQLAEQQL